MNDLVQAKGRGLLARWEFLKGLQPLPHERLSGHHQVYAVRSPTLVVDPFLIGSLEGVGLQVEQFRKTQRNHWILPNIQAVCTLLHAYELPLVEPQSREVAIISAV